MLDNTEADIAKYKKMYNDAITQELTKQDSDLSESDAKIIANVAVDRLDFNNEVHMHWSIQSISRDIFEYWDLQQILKQNT